MGGGGRGRRTYGGSFASFVAGVEQLGGWAWGQNLGLEAGEGTGEVDGIEVGRVLRGHGGSCHHGCRRGSQASNSREVLFLPSRSCHEC